MMYAPYECPGPNGDWRDDGKYSVTGYHHCFEEPAMGVAGTCYYCHQPCTVRRWDGKVYWVADAPTIKEDPF